MKKFLPSLCALLILGGCDNPQNTVASLKEEIRAYRAEPTDPNQAAIEKSFAKLDALIASAEKAGRAAEADSLRSQASDLRADYQAAKISRAVNDAKNAIQGFGNSLKDAAHSIGDAFKGQTNSSD